jgi:hypothetical protein
VDSCARSNVYRNVRIRKYIQERECQVSHGLLGGCAKARGNATSSATQRRRPVNRHNLPQSATAIHPSPSRAVQGYSPADPPLDSKATWTGSLNGSRSWFHNLWGLSVCRSWLARSQRSRGFDHFGIAGGVMALRLVSLPARGWECLGGPDDSQADE